MAKKAQEADSDRVLQIAKAVLSYTALGLTNLTSWLLQISNQAFMVFLYFLFVANMVEAKTSHL